jgi:signal transduction histidine kinase
VVATKPVTIDINGDTGGPLGNLACAILGTLNNVVGLVKLLTSLLGVVTGLLGTPDWRFGWHGADVSVSDEIRPRTRRRQPRRLGPNLSNHVRAARAVLVKHGHSSNDALARLESPFDQFRRLTAEVSPELRTPLLIIQAFRRSNCAIGYRRRQGSGIQWTG